MVTPGDHSAADTLTRVDGLVELDLDSGTWMDFVRSRADALPFHHPAWALLLAECYGFRPFALALASPDGQRVAGGLPILETRTRLRSPRWISLPFTDICPPLVDAEDAARLLSSLHDARRAADVARLELRGSMPGVASVPAALRHTLRLDTTREEVARGFDPSTRRNVRAAERSPITIRFAEQETDLDVVFYELHVNTRRRHGLPVQPRRFFKLLWRRVLDRGLGFTLFVCYEGVPVAGAVFLTWNGTITYKYGASEPSFWHLRPNNALFWEVIGWGCENGYDTLDFGRTDTDGEGLRRFKLGWGCQEEYLGYVAFGGGTSNSHDSARTVLRPLLQRSPRWLIRALGHLFYRQAA